MEKIDHHLYKQIETTSAIITGTGHHSSALTSRINRLFQLDDWLSAKLRNQSASTFLKATCWSATRMRRATLGERIETARLPWWSSERQARATVVKTSARHRFHGSRFCSNSNLWRSCFATSLADCSRSGFFASQFSEEEIWSKVRLLDDCVASDLWS